VRKDASTPPYLLQMPRPHVLSVVASFLWERYNIVSLVLFYRAGANAIVILDVVAALHHTELGGIGALDHWRRQTNSNNNSSTTTTTTITTSSD
jgi:hypothetical protein